MPIRVVQVATGNAGRIALSQLISDPRFELAGLVSSSEEKSGRDAGELAGLDVVTGVTATGNLAAALAKTAEPGIRTTLDLPFGTANGVFATTLTTAH